AWAAGRDLTYVALLLVGLWLLRRLLRSVRDRDPFTEDNVKRLRALALLILIGFPLARLVASLFEGELASSAGFLHHGLRLSLTGSALIGGLAAFALAEVFAAGVRMRVDLEGTV
ncbi:MAG: hypothetical protein QOE64_2814, partial [Frankiales bacterium]|nr:hypothetical protein [Frankiales bacterium]